MIEVEVRGKVKNFSPVRTKLRKLKAKTLNKEKQEDRIFSRPQDLDNNHKMVEGSFVGRIRARGKKVTLEFKEIKRTGAGLEFCLPLDHTTDGINFFNKIGFKEAFPIIKTREFFKYKNFEICLDKVKYLGNFIEIETRIKNGRNKEKLIEKCKELLLIIAPKTQLTEKKYGDLISEKKFKSNENSKTEPVFKPRKGQVDYTNIRYAPVINCVVRHKSKILIVQRNPKMRLYPGLWNGISGFLDDARSIEEKVKDELREELGIKAKDILLIYRGPVFDQEEKKYKKTWIVHPVLIDVMTDKIKLDWESQKYKWIEVRDAKNFDLLPGFDKVLVSLFP